MAPITSRVEEFQVAAGGGSWAAAGEDWEVKEKGATRSVKVFENKTDAIGRAKELAKKAPLGQVVIRNDKGKIQTEYTYGADPRKTPG